MSLGNNIRTLREEKQMTQERLAEQLGVSFQAVSSWEREEYNPDLERLMAMTRIFDVSLSSLVEEKMDLKTTKAIYDCQHMKTFVKTSAKNLGLSNTLKALDFAEKAHEGQDRKNSDIPYIYHPLNLACHGLAMKIHKDEVIAACLLHDVIEDCHKQLSDLPVNDETRHLVDLMTHEKDDSRRQQIMEEYYRRLAENPDGALIKCLDRCNNLTTMAWGLSRERIYRMIRETEQYIIPLLKVIKSTAEYNDAAWLLQYQMESMLDIYKRLL